MMNLTRRTFLSTLTVALASSYSVLARAAAWPSNQFNAKGLDDALSALTQKNSIASSDKIHLKVPAIAENGAVVPITVTTELPNVSAISILVEHNPTPLTSRFTFANNVEPFVSTRVKMAETSRIVAVVESDDKYYSVEREIKVTIGGCGG